MFVIDDAAIIAVEEVVESTVESGIEAGLEASLEGATESISLEEEFSLDKFSDFLSKEADLAKGTDIKPDIRSVDNPLSESSEFRSGEFVKDVVPDGHNGMNAEGRTLDEIVHNPVTESCRETAAQNLENSGASQNSIEHLLKDFCGTHESNSVPDPSIDRQVDLRPTKVGTMEVDCPSPEEYSDLTGKPSDQITSSDIRHVNYEKFQEAMAEKYDITPQQAEKFIGDCDLCIHESADGKMYLVPNNVHMYTELYGHNGYVAQTLGQLKG